MDQKGKTLHKAKSREEAKLIIESVPPDKRREFILSAVDEKQCTALHIQTSQDRVDVVEYICRLFSECDTLLLAKDSNGRTALHYAKTKNLAELLVNSVSQKNQNNFILSADETQCTALHDAASQSQTDVVEYLCSLPVKDELVFAKDDTGCTALHSATKKRVAQLLVESIIPNKKRDFILSASTYYRHTALHLAVKLGRTDVVEYLCSLPVKDELLLAKNIQGWTALHYSKNEKVAKLLVESLKPEKRRYFLYMINTYYATALHVAAYTGRIGVVKYLCSLYPNNYELMRKKDSLDCNVLHNCENGNIARIVLESLTIEQQKHILNALNKFQHTPLQEAVILGKFDTVKYLCSVHKNIDEFVYMKDTVGGTIFHYVYDRNTAELLINSAKGSNVSKMLSTINTYAQTVLHIAARGGRNDLIEYFCGFITNVDELVLAKDKFGKTVLHYAANEKTAKLCLLLVTPVNQQKLTLSVDNCQRTALHDAASVFHKSEIAEFLCSKPLANDELICARNSAGQTALHLACNSRTVEAILKIANSNTLLFLLTSEDSEGSTPLLSLTKSENSDGLRRLLQHIEELHEQRIIKLCLQKHNRSKQNILHLAAMSFRLALLYDVLVDYLHYIEVTSMMYPDENGNTPIHYAAANCSPKVFADFMLRFPLPMRRYIVNHSNEQQTTCLKIIARTPFHLKFYHKKVLGLEGEIPSTSSKARLLELGIMMISNYVDRNYHLYNENIFKVCNHTLNQYTLPYYISLNALANEPQIHKREGRKVSYYV